MSIIYKTHQKFFYLIIYTYNNLRYNVARKKDMIRADL